MENALKSLPSTDRQEFADFEQDPTFLETIGASLAYKYDPLMDRINEASTFELSPEEGYVPKDNIPNDLKPFASTLLRATNQKHMNFLTANIREGQETRRVLERSGIGLQFAAELFDPINYIGIPFARAASFGQNFLRSGVSTGAVVSAQEAVRFPLDPLATKEEAMFTIGSSFLIGGAIGGTISIPSQRRAEALRSGEVEIKRLEEAIMPVDDKPPTAEIAASFFTDSWIYKAVPTPLKSILTDKSVPNSVKLRTLKIANDSGILLAANREGKKIGNSTYQNAKLFDGEWVSVFDDVMNIWGESTGKGVVSFLDYSIKTNFDKWFALIDSKAMRGIAPADDFEARAINKINSFYETWEKRLTEQGEIGTVGHYSKIIIKKNKRIEAIQKRLNGNISPEYRLTLEGQLRRQAEQIDEMQAIIKDIEETGGPVMPPNEKVFRPRYWDFDAIKANREAFETILRNWYTANPSIISRGQNGKYGRVDLSNNEKAVAARAKSTVDTILGIKDVTDPDIGYYGMGKSKHFKHRLVDIPNELVLDFIQTNPTAVMKAYTQRVGPRYEFSRQFDGQSIDDILDDTFNEMMDAGSTREQAHKAMKNMRALYKRVVGGVQRDPESWDQKFAKTLRDLAQLNYLGSAGFSTITEPAKIMMEHGIGKTMRGLFSIMKDSQLSLGAKEGRMAAEGLDNLLHTAHLRIVDDVNNNPFKSDIFDRIKHPFYALNLLGPFTKILKDFDAMMRSHTLIDYSVRWSQGKATKMEQEYLLRYNIDLEDAKKIANAPWQKSQSGMYMANTQAWTNSIEFPSTTADVISGPTGVNRANGDYSPAFYRASDNKIFIDEEHVIDIMYPERGWENPRIEGVKPIEKGIINSPEDYVAFVKMHEIMHSLNSAKSLGFDKRTKIGKAGYENAINDLAVAEFKKQARVDPETVKTFRSALSGGILNTILMGTPADKPMITDGIVYIPMRVARQFGMKEDPEFTGYARIENGLLGLPFQFFSYSFAALNKTTAAYGHGQLKNQWLGSAIAIGLGYMVLQYKTPSFVDMSFQDQFSRAFDYSGIMPLYSDIMYTAMSTSLALGGPNLTGGILQPRFPARSEGVRAGFDAATGVLGAGPSIGTDLGFGLYNLVTGNTGEGTKEVIRNLPYARLWLWKNKMNEFTRMLETEIDGPSGFGRY
jgi:hypothetical protein